MRPTIIIAAFAAAGCAYAGDKPSASATVEATADAVFVAAADACCAACADCPCCSGAGAKQGVVVKKKGDAARGKAKAFKVIIEDGEAKVTEVEPGEGFGVFHGPGPMFTFKGLPEGSFRVFGEGDGEHGFRFVIPDGDDVDLEKMAPGVFRFRGGDDGPGLRLRFDDDHEVRVGPGADRPRLGVMIEEEDDALVIADVMDGYPAEDAGLESGDVIVGINGAGPATLDRLRKALGASTVTLTITRDGDKDDVTVELRDDDDLPRWRTAPGPGGAMRGRVRGLDEEAMKLLHERLEAAEDALEGLDLDFDIEIDADSTKAAREALEKALSGMQMPREAREELHRALEGLRAGRHARAHALREREHIERGRAHAQRDRARDRQRDAGGLEGRLKRLEERMARLEQALKKLAEKE
ncbi:MAG: PDZ domain-containing protein [Planctomycetota bacterium]|nr:MAG: PDZ domain-containing protein [Planctomycetota bacterium]